MDMTTRKKVNIYTDGACSGNPGPGGWATILKCLKSDGTFYTKELYGGDVLTTNNKMELTAVIKGLEALKEPCDVTIYSDSQYVVNAFNNNWLKNWQNNGWKKSNKEPVKNIPLWESLISLTKKHRVTFMWVKGHNGHPENEKCDTLAVMQRDLHSRK